MAALNPYTGERYDYSEMGDVTIHGYHALRSRTFTDPFENLLKVDAAELDPSTHPGAENSDQVGSTIWYNGLPTIRAKAA